MDPSQLVRDSISELTAVNVGIKFERFERALAHLDTIEAHTAELRRHCVEQIAATNEAHS
jgi:hypothetical protein